MSREVPLFVPDVGVLDLPTVQAITNIVFCTNDLLSAPRPENANSIFCFCAPVGAQEQAAAVLSAIHHDSGSSVDHVILAGKDGAKYGGEPHQPIPQSEVLLTAMGPVPQGITVTLDKTSTNTLENAVHGFAALKKPLGDVVGICSRSFHMGRCARTFLAVAEQNGWSGRLTYLPYNVAGANDGTGITVSASDWYAHEGPKSRVISELARIAKYGARGDVFLSPQDRTHLNRMSGLIQRLG